MPAGAQISQLLGKAALHHRLFACEHAGSEAAICHFTEGVGGAGGHTL